MFEDFSWDGLNYIINQLTNTYVNWADWEVRSSFFQLGAILLEVPTMGSGRLGWRASFFPSSAAHQAGGRVDSTSLGASGVLEQSFVVNVFPCSSIRIHHHTHTQRYIYICIRTRTHTHTRLGRKFNSCSSTSSLIRNLQFRNQ